MEDSSRCPGPTRIIAQIGYSNFLINSGKGIKNKYTNQGKTFYVNVYLNQLGGALAGQSATSMQADVSRWLTYAPSEFVNAGDSKDSQLIIKPDAGADAGIYQFRVLVCESQPCTTLEATPEANIYGTESFALEIEAF